MPDIYKLLQNNRDWAKEVTENDPTFFSKLAEQQSPRHLWIGCSDSRVPANQITGLEPGRIFVHRNISNLVLNNDINVLAVLQYSIDVLKVEHIIVCGHYGCGGVKAAMEQRQAGVLEFWINNIRRTINASERLREGRSKNIDEKSAFDIACEENVKTQIENLANNPLVLAAWERNQKLAVHGWIYRLEDGLIRDLGVTRRAPAP